MDIRIPRVYIEPIYTYTKDSIKVGTILSRFITMKINSYQEYYTKNLSGVYSTIDSYTTSEVTEAIAAELIKEYALSISNWVSNYKGIITTSEDKSTNKVEDTNKKYINIITKYMNHIHTKVTEYEDSYTFTNVNLDDPCDCSVIDDYLNGLINCLFDSDCNNDIITNIRYSCFVTRVFPNCN